MISKRKLLKALAAGPAATLATSVALGQEAAPAASPSASAPPRRAYRRSGAASAPQGAASGMTRAQSGKPARAAAAAVNWPTQPVRILVGFPAGSSPDLVTRAMSDSLAKALGQPVLVENKPGASGNLVADLVAKSRDNHTIGALINGNLTVAKLLNPAVPFDPAKDFAPISLLGTAPLVLAVGASAPGNTPEELLLWLRNQDSKASYGTPGSGTVGHLGMELLKSKTGIAANHIPFPGNPQVVSALLAGQIQLALLPPGLTMPHVRAGRLKAVAVTSPGRSPFAPELPALRDVGVMGTDLEIWIALAGAASLPAPVVAKLSAAVAEVVRQPETRGRMLGSGWLPVGTAPEGLVNRMQSDTAKLAGIIMMRNIKADS